MIAATWSILAELAPWLLVGAAAAGLLHVALPEGFVHRQLSGRMGVVKAVLLGVPLPLCSCGVIPAGLGLKRDGASDGAAVAFLVATPQTGVDSILVSAGFLGWPFALFKVGAAVVTGLAAGWLTDAVSPSHHVDGPVEQVHAHGPWWQRALHQADDVLASIWRWLVFGVLVSAALTVWIPADALADTVLASGVFAGVTVLAISLPLYVCATASVPIAAALLHAGLPPSAALVFLMAGPASNVATVGAVYRAFGARTLGVYLGTVAVGSLGLGMLFDTVLPGAGVPPGHVHGAWWADLAAVALLALFVRYAVAEWRAWRAPAVDVAAPVHDLPVAGMTCEGCARKVGDAVRGVEGVTAVEVALADGRVTIQGAASMEAVREAVRRAGFRPAA